LIHDYSKLLDDSNLDAKKYWEIIIETRGKNRREGIKETKIAEETISTENNPGRVAEEFNKFYHSVVDNLMKNVSFDSSQDNDEGMGVLGVDLGADSEMENGYSLILDGFRLTVDDVEKAISSLKNKSSVGADSVS